MCAAFVRYTKLAFHFSYSSREKCLSICFCSVSPSGISGEGDIERGDKKETG